MRNISHIQLSACGDWRAMPSQQQVTTGLWTHASLQRLCRAVLALTTCAVLCVLRTGSGASSYSICKAWASSLASISNFSPGQFGSSKWQVWSLVRGKRGDRLWGLIVRSRFSGVGFGSQLRSEHDLDNSMSSRREWPWVVGHLG